MPLEIIRPSAKRKIIALFDIFFGDKTSFRRSSIISAGQASDISKAAELVKGSECAHMLADKGYDSDKLRNKLKEEGITSVNTRKEEQE